MGAMNKANGRQSNRNKSKFQAVRATGLLEIHKRKKIAKQAHREALKDLHPPKVPRGAARRLRRKHMLHMEQRSTTGADAIL